MKKIKILLLVVCAVFGGITSAGNLVETGKKLFVPTEDQKLFLTVVEEKRKVLSALDKKIEAFTDTQKSFTEALEARLSELKRQIDIVQQQIKREPDNEVVNRKLALLNEDYQILKDQQQSRENQIKLAKEHRDVLSEYLKDPNRDDFRKKLNVNRDLFTLEDLQRITQMHLDAEKKVQQLKDQEEHIALELKNRKQTLEATEQAYRKKKNEQRKILEKEGDDLQHDSQLFSLEEQIYIDKKELDTLRLQEIEQKKELLQSKLLVAQLHASMLKEALDKIKPAIRVTKADLATAQQALVKKKQQAFKAKDTYRQGIDYITNTKKDHEQVLRQLSDRYGIDLDNTLDKWERSPVETSMGYLQLIDISLINERVRLLDRKKELLEAQMALEDEKIRHETLHTDSKSTIYKITTGKFIEEEEAKQELKKYDAPRAEVKANLSLFKDRRRNAQDELDQLRKALFRVQDLRQAITGQRLQVFRGRSKEYLRAIELLDKVEANMQEQMELLRTISSTYAEVIASLDKSTKEIDFVTNALETTTIWQRSKHAITWDGVTNIIPDMQRFFVGIKNYLITFDFDCLISKLSNMVSDPFMLFLLVLQLLLVLAIYRLLKRFLPKLEQGFAGIANRNDGWVGFAAHLFALVTGYVKRYLSIFYPWLAFFIFLRLYDLESPYPYVLLYLVSIPYLLYLAYLFVRYMVKYNHEYDYVFLTKEYHRRFITVFSVLLYGTIAIFFFRQAFILGAFYKSELPTILLAINFIILQISLIFLIAKEQILSVIPDSPGIWETVREYVDKYYYLILMIAIAVIVMSNPFVGFGKLVQYIISRVLLSIFVGLVLVWLHNAIRKGFSHVFFVAEHDVTKERFTYGKSLYGFCVIFALISFIFFGVMAAAKIWGWPEGLADINNWADLLGWLKEPILLKETAKISLFSILQILFFIAVGFFVSFLMNRFVLNKIFDVLLVDVGVQNAVSSIVRYIIMIVTAILGFQSVGLGDLVLWLIGALIVGIGWVIKDPIGDFLSYFIILVQRPLKIGDFIKLDSEVSGVVRKITPRSVVIRRKNSTTIIMPNSSVIAKPIVNWNYVRGFVAFNDIVLTVGYEHDPQKVKEYLLIAMSENSYVLKNPKPIVRLQDFTEHGFEFMCRGYISSNYTLDQWDIASDIRFAIVQRLRTHKIKIAVPTRIILSNPTRREEVGMPEGPARVSDSVPSDSGE